MEKGRPGGRPFSIRARFARYFFKGRVRTRRLQFVQRIV